MNSQPIEGSTPAVKPDCLDHEKSRTSGSLAHNVGAEVDVTTAVAPDDIEVEEKGDIAWIRIDPLKSNGRLSPSHQIVLLIGGLVCTLVGAAAIGFLAYGYVVEDKPVAEVAALATLFASLMIAPHLYRLRRRR